MGPHLPVTKETHFQNVDGIIVKSDSLLSHAEDSGGLTMVRVELSSHCELTHSTSILVDSASMLLGGPGIQALALGDG